MSGKAIGSWRDARGALVGSFVSTSPNDLGVFSMDLDDEIRIPRPASPASTVKFLPLFYPFESVGRYFIPLNYN